MLKVSRNTHPELCRDPRYVFLWKDNRLQFLKDNRLHLIFKVHATGQSLDPRVWKKYRFIGKYANHKQTM